MAKEPAQQVASAKLVVLAFSIDEDDNVIVMPTTSAPRALSSFDRLREIIKAEPAAQPQKDNSLASLASRALDILSR